MNDNAVQEKNEALQIISLLVLSAKHCKELTYRVFKNELAVC